MEIPKYIDKALKRRTKLAEQLMETCYIVDTFIRKNGLEDKIPTEDWGSGAEVFSDPTVSENVVRKAIERK